MHVCVRFELAQFLGRYIIDHARWNSQVVYDLVIDELETTAPNRTHCVLRMARNSKLANDKHIQRRTQAASYLEGDKRAATRQAKRCNVLSVRVCP